MIIMARNDTAQDAQVTEAEATAVATVQPVDEDVMPGRQGRKSSLDDSPVIGWLTASAESGKAKSVPANDEEDAKRIRALLRRAATRMEIGLDTAVKQDGNGTWKCYFQARGKRAYTA